jgi:hypothetical protein
MSWATYMDAHAPSTTDMERALRAAGIDSDPATWSADTCADASKILDELTYGKEAR